MIAWYIINNNASSENLQRTIFMLKFEENGPLDEEEGEGAEKR